MQSSGQENGVSGSAIQKDPSGSYLEDGLEVGKPGDRKTN